MSTVGNLNINLSLTSAEFKKGIQDVNRQLKIAQSEFKLAGAGVQGFGKSLDGMRSKSQHLEQTLQLQRSKVEQLRQMYEQLKSTKGEDDAATQRMLVAYNNAQAAMRRTESDLGRLNDQIRLQSSQWHQLGERLTEAGQSMQKIGQSMKNVGSQLSMKVTAPIVGIGAAAVKAGADFEEGMDKVSAVSGATGEDFNKLRDQAKELGATTKYSATEAADGMQFLAMAGFKTNDILKAMPGMLDLAAAGALELGAAADITSNIMSGFGIEAAKSGHISDVLAKAASNANTDVTQMGEAMKYLAPAAKVLGWSVEESAAAVMAFGDAGIQGSLAGQAFATSLTRLAKDPTPKMQDALDKLNFSFFTAEGTMKSMPEIIAGLEKNMAGWTDQQKAATITTLFGAEAFKHWAVLIDKGSDALGKNTDMLINADGAAKKMAKTMSDNAKGDIKTLMSALEGLAIQLSDILLPILSDGAKKLTELTRKFAAMSPETQKTILAVAGVAAALGPLLVIGGTLVSSLGAIFTAFGTVSGAIAVVTTGVAASTPAVGALATAFTVLTGPVGLVIAGLAALTAGGVVLYKHLQKDAIPEVNRFGDEVSKSTKKALEGYFELSDGASQKLTELSLTQQEVSKKTKDSLINIYSQMNEQILAKMNERHTKQLESMQSFFLNSTALTTAEEEKVLQDQEIRNNAEISKQQYKEDRIKEILEKATAEKRALTEAEQATINGIQQSMNENAVQYLSKNEVESKVIMERMKQTAGDLSARQAAEVVQNSFKQKDEAVKAAEEQYDKTIEQIIRMRDETGAITTEQADQMIREATKQRDEVVMRAEDLHSKVVKEAQEQAKEHIDHINWETGEVLSKWESMTKKMEVANQLALQISKKYWKEISSEVVASASQLKESAVSKFNDLKNEAGRKFAEAKSNMLKPVKEAKNEISGLISDVKGFFSNLSLKFPKVQMPKLPHFKLTGSFSFNPPSVPKLGVEWYANGGLMTKPTAFGMNGSTLMIGGEAGHEAILPLTDRVLGSIGSMIAKTMENNQQTNYTPNIEITLNYSGNNAEDAYKMADIVERELNKRAGLSMRMAGVR
ncbi:phage tail tape measure protein [Bacillus infantis]|uniref:phage tail tape measure protein n=1 Tax=Bacillus infantis TaxID=324767 RepID=UPI003CF87E0F